jgi:hypothetical protein
VLVRERADDGGDLVISRDYINRGLCACTAQLIWAAQRAGNPPQPRAAGRRRPLDASRLGTHARGRLGLIDLRPACNEPGDFERTMLAEPARELELLGLAALLGPGQWMLSEEAEGVLLALGERGETTKRIYAALRSAPTPTSS